MTPVLATLLTAARTHLDAPTHRSEIALQAAVDAAAEDGVCAPMGTLSDAQHAHARAFADHEHTVAALWPAASAADPTLRANEFAARHPFVAPAAA